MRPGLLTAPYAEGAAMQLARAPGLLEKAYVGAAVSTRRPAVGGVLQFAGLPQYDLQRAFRAAGMQRYATWSMYRAHAQHDAWVARRVAGDELPFCVAMPGAALKTWAALPTRSRRVLHVVNGHPVHHNEVLAALPTKVPKQEFVPADVVERVEREFLVADLLLVPSRLMVEQLSSRGVPASKIEVVPYGVDPVLFAPQTRLEPGGPAAAFLFVGQISQRKGLRYLIESMRSLPHTTLRLVGPVVDPSLLRDLPSNVKFIGSLGRQALSLVLRTATALVLPSIEDSFGLVALEAMASGTPTIVSTACGASELLHECDALARFCVPPCDAPALTAALSELAALPLAEWTVLSGRATAIALAHTWDVYRERIESAVQGLVG